VRTIKPLGRFSTAADVVAEGWMWPRPETALDDGTSDQRVVATRLSRRLHIITVHGTWGRGFLSDPPNSPIAKRASWCTPKSPFTAKLGRTLRDAEADYMISDFLWSGENSITVRNDAAGILATYLAQHLRDNPNWQPVIVAHSHGGNIALRALEVLRERKIELEGKGLSLITIATPFVQIKAAAHSWIKTFTLFNTSLMVILFISALMYGLMNGSNIGFVGVIAMSAIILLILRLMLLGMGLGRVGDPAIFHPALIKASYYPPYDGSFNFLIVRGVEDEASMTLMLSALGNRIIDVLIAIAGYVAVICGAVFGIVLIIHYWAILSGHESPTSGPLNYTFWTLLGVSSCVYLSTRIAALCRSVFGRELYASALEVAVSAHSVPDLRAQARVITLSRGDQADISLLHSLYNHERCAEEIACWLSEKNASR
jgi:hypothetical protein